jgi:hypothetical protein
LDLRGRRWQEAGEDYITKSFMTCTLLQILLGDHVKEDGMGRACSLHGRYEKCIKLFGWEI